MQTRISKYRRLAKVARLTFLVALMAGAQSCSQEAQRNNIDPMEDSYSQAVRDEYTKCREESSPFTQFFCACRVLEEQCDAPRRLEHGNWKTVEFWPSKDEAEREVHFVMSIGSDLFGDFDNSTTGLVMTCLKGTSELTAYIEEGIDQNVPPVARFGEELFAAYYKDEGGDLIVNFEDPKAVFERLNYIPVVSISYSDSGGAEHTVEFETYGFDVVTQGWESLCANKNRQPI